MKTFEKVMEIFRDYLDSDQEEEVEKLAEQFCQRLRKRWEEETK